MPMMIATSIVATRTNATGNGPYFAPSHKESPTPTTNWTKTAGNRRIRPIAYQVRVVALAAEFEFAMAELATARNTKTQPAPHTFLARASHGFPPPKPANPANLLGPKKTTAA